LRPFALALTCHETLAYRAAYPNHRFFST
jgi:hypothetical protein